MVWPAVLARLGIKFSSAKWRFGRKIQSAPGSAGPPAEAANRASMQPAAGGEPLDSSVPNASARPRVPESGENRPIGSISAWFRPDSRLFVKKAGLIRCHRTAFALLHSRSAFGIALPLTASDRRHNGCGCSSVVEHDLAKVGVEGSSPFARSNFSQLAITDATTGRLLAALLFCGLVVLRPGWF